MYCAVCEHFITPFLACTFVPFIFEKERGAPENAKREK